MKRSQVAWERAEEKGISFRESEQMVDLELCLDEYPWWGLGTPNQSVVLHKNVPPCHRARVERGRMHVPPRLLR